MRSSRKQYQSRLLFPTPGNLPDPGIKPTSLTFVSLADGFFITAPPGKPKGEFAAWFNKGCWWMPVMQACILFWASWFWPALRKGRDEVSRRGCMRLTLCNISGHKLRGSEGDAYKCPLKRQSGISNVEFASEHFAKSLAHSVDKYLVDEWLNKSSRAAVF